MSDVSGLLEVMKLYGPSALFFAVWYLDRKATNEQWSKIIDQMVKSQAENFELLKDMIQTNILQTALLQRIESLIVNNQWCPYIKRFLEKGEVNGKSDNYAA